MKVTRKSQFTGVEHTRELDVTQDQIDLWRLGGQYVQDVFPHLSADDREFLLTGVTPEEWTEAFGSEDEDDGTPGGFIESSVPEGDK